MICLSRQWPGVEEEEAAVAYARHGVEVWIAGEEDREICRESEEKKNEEEEESEKVNELRGRSSGSNLSVRLQT